MEAPSQGSRVANPNLRCPDCGRTPLRWHEISWISEPPEWWPEGVRYTSPLQLVEITWCNYCNYRNERFDEDE